MQRRMQRIIVTKLPIKVGRNAEKNAEKNGNKTSGLLKKINILGPTILEGHDGVSCN
jgi:hypothetical protein